MAWVRIDDQVPRHAKMLKAGPAACWLWVCGIAHAQSQLTDGFISDDVLPMIGVPGKARCQRLAGTLVDAGLFERADGGYRVHGYLDMNPSRDAVIGKRAEDAQRKRRGEGRRQDRRENPDGVQTDSVRSPELPARASHPIPSRPIPSPGDPPRSSAHGPLPGFPRVRVFRWMVDRLTASVGDAPFDLEAWLLSLEQNTRLVIPAEQEARWKWLQEALDYELRAKGLLAAAGSDEARVQQLTAKGPSIRPGAAK